jgi:hypothetical protein
MDSCAVMLFAVTGVFRITGEPRMSFQIPSPIMSKHWILNVHTSAFSGCVCPTQNPWKGNYGDQ